MRAAHSSGFQIWNLPGMLSQNAGQKKLEGGICVKERFLSIFGVLIAAAVIILISSGCCLGIFYWYRPVALTITESNGLLGVCIAIVILAASRIIAQAAIVLLGGLWLAYIGWLIVSNERRDIDQKKEAAV